MTEPKRHLIVPYIQRSYKRKQRAAFLEALDEARSHARDVLKLPLGTFIEVRHTGRTFHDDTDWAFEFSFVEPKGAK